MPVLEPFRGLRYDPSVPLDQVICPPYDVIEPKARATLAARHPQNAVHVEAPEAPEGEDRYDHAAELLATWQRRGLVRRDPEPALYVYRMGTPEGGRTTGVIGALRLPSEGEGDIRPHEETLAKPLGDRLELLRATRANLSPIWLLSTHRGLSELLATGAEPTARAADDQGVTHELWRVEDPELCRRIAAAVAAAPLVVADGHHRYQTALHYREERVGNDGAQLILAYVVELAPDQLEVGAIHRVLRGVGGPDVALEAARARFNVVRAGPLNPTVASALETSGNLGLLTREGIWLLSARAESEADVLDPELVAPLIEEMGMPVVDFAHGATEAVEEVAEGRADAALLLRPVTVEQIGTWAAEERRMPPKTTYFHPKPRTGMVFRSLDD